MQTENSRAEIAYYDSGQESAVEWLIKDVYYPLESVRLLINDNGHLNHVVNEIYPHMN